MVGNQRVGEVDRVLERLLGWARRQSDVRAVALVGSWARDEASEDSDIDVVLLTTMPDRYIEAEEWLHAIDGTRILKTERWGAATERRLVLGNGLEVEVDISTPEWASVAPVDPGTARVVLDGMRAIYDPDALLKSLHAACQRLG